MPRRQDDAPLLEMRDAGARATVRGAAALAHLDKHQRAVGRAHDEVNLAATATRGFEVGLHQPQAAGPAAVRGFPPVGWACFGSVSPWEVVDGEGRKLVGMAQRRRKQGVLLVAGTLVGPTDWRLLCDALGQPADAVALRERTVCMQELTRLGAQAQGLAGLQGAQRFAAHLQGALQEALQDGLQEAPGKP